jgi:hypothetical protein
MVSLDKAIEIFKAENFDVFMANKNKVALIYLPEEFQFESRVTTLSFDNYQEGRALVAKFKILSKNRYPKMGFDWDNDMIDLNTISEASLVNRVHDLMESAKMCLKEIKMAKRINSANKDF